MKTNQVMIRKMGDMEVQQRTKDAYFNATELLRSYNAMMATLTPEQAQKVDLNNIDNQEVLNTTKRWNVETINNQEVPNTTKGWEFRRLDVFLKTEQTNAFVVSIAKNEGKDVREIIKASRGRYGSTWVHPLLFIDICMWLNPDFKYQALKFVQDKMLEYRDLACESYKDLASNVAKLVSKDGMESAMRRVARGVNYVVFNTHNPGERNLHATDAEQMRLFNFQNSLSFAIKTGLIKTYEQLINFLRDRWMEAWDPFQRDLALKEAKSNLITA